MGLIIFLKRVSLIPILSLIFNAVTVISAQASDPPCYIVDSRVLTDGVSCSGTVTIDDSVTSIGNSAFAYNTALASVIIPNSVTSIGNSAFANNTALASVTLGNSLTSIGDEAFRDNTALTSIVFPDSLSSIGSNAFASSGLTSLTIPGTVNSIGDAAFQQMGFLSSVVIQEGITSLPNQAFYINFANPLVSISLPNSLTSIGPAAFFGAGFTSLTIPNSVETIGDSAFAYSLLTSVTIPNSVTSIGDAAFQGLNLASVTLGNSLTSIGNNAFSDIATLASIIIPNSVTSIGISAFENNHALASVTFGNSVTSIGNYAFSGNTALTSLNFLGSNAPANSLGGYISMTSFLNLPETATAYVPSGAAYYEDEEDGLADGKWYRLIVSKGDAPAFTLSSSSEVKTVNNPISGYTIDTSTGGVVASYSISPAAPAGLTFETSTGLLTGTPTSIASATSYTITATNSWGSASRTFTLTVNAAPAPSNTSSPVVVNHAPSPTKKQPKMVLVAEKTTLSWLESTPIKLTGGVESGTVTYQNTGDTICLVDTKSNSLVTTTPGTCVIAAINSGDFEYIWEQSNEIKITVLAQSSIISKSAPAKSSKTTKCVRGKITKYVNKGSKCPKGFKLKK